MWDGFGYIEKGEGGEEDKKHTATIITTIRTKPKKKLHEPTGKYETAHERN